MLSTLPPDIGSGLRGFRPGRVVADAGQCNHVTRLPTDGPTGQKNRITASNGTNEATYTARFVGGGTAAGVDVTVTAVATASSATGVRGPLLAAIVASSLLMAYIAEIEAVSTDAIDVWAIEGATLTVTFPTNPSTHLSTSATAAVDRPQYRWGRAVEVVAPPALPGRMIGSGIRHPVAIGGVDLDLTQTHDASGAYQVRLLVDGAIETISWVKGGDAAATDVAAAAAWEAKSFIADATVEGTGVIAVTGMPGVEITVVDATATGGSAAMALAIGSGGQADPLPRFALVLDERATPTLDTMPQTVPTGPLPGVAVLTADPSNRSTVYAVEAPGASISGTAVYVETYGDDAGRLYDTPSATRTPWPEARWRGFDATDPSIAYVEI